MAKQAQHGTSYPWIGAYHPQPDMTIDDAMMRLGAIEGYRGHPYDDTRGYSTIGYGCLLPLSEREAMVIARMRMDAIYADLIRELHRREVRWYKLPPPLRRELLIAAYNLGVGGLMGFEKMLKALAEGDLLRAADEVANSRWYHQVPSRADRLRQVLRELH